MGTWGLLQVVFDIFAALGFLIIIMRMSRAPKDDPRLSRGLQLLQSKIAVIEDLSDRTEVQVNQLTTLLEQKAKEVQAKIQLAEQSVQAIKVSMQNSLEVAKIFQDKIPHQEIIERQNSIKYVQAARFAHQGMSVDEIATKVELPKGEIEFIAKVNRDQLMFNEESLPEWAKSEGAESVADANIEAAVASQVAMATSPNAMQPEAAPAAIPEGPLAHLNFAEAETDQASRFRAEIELAERQRLVEHLSRLQFEMQSLDMQLARESSSRNISAAFEAPRVNGDALHKLGEEFRKACENVNDQRSLLPPLEQLSSLIPQIFPAGDARAPQAHSTLAPARPPNAEQRLTGPQSSVNASAAVAVVSSPPAPPMAAAPLIRKVVFPRIEANEV